MTGFVGSEEAESGFILGAVVIFRERLSKAVGKNLPLICRWGRYDAITTTIDVA